MARFGTEAHQVFAVLVMHKLLLSDLLHLLSKALDKVEKHVLKKKKKVAE